MKLADLLKDKKNKLVSVTYDANISFIYEVMKAHRVHHIAVMQGQTFMGLIDQEALLDSILISPLNFNSLEAQDIMRRNVPSVSPENTIEDVVKLMKEKNLPAIPYMEDGHCKTLITRTDILRLVYEYLHDNQADEGDIIDKALQKSELMMTNPVLLRTTKLLSDIGI